MTVAFLNDIISARSLLQAEQKVANQLLTLLSETKDKKEEQLFELNLLFTSPKVRNNAWQSLLLLHSVRSLIGFSISKNTSDNFENNIEKFQNILRNTLKILEKCFGKFREFFISKNFEKFREILLKCLKNFKKNFENYCEEFRELFYKILRNISENFENYVGKFRKSFYKKNFGRFKKILRIFSRRRYFLKFQEILFFVKFK